MNAKQGLDDRVLVVNSKPSPFDNYSTVRDETILAIAAAFRELERTADTNMPAAQAMRDDMYHWKQRAEAAEAKLAALENQKPMAYRWESPVNGKICHDGIKPLGVISQPLYLQSAPAVNLADLVPDSWKLVPIEPTEEMVSAGDQFMDGLSRLGDAYEAMLAAAPEPE